MNSDNAKEDPNESFLTVSETNYDDGESKKVLALEEISTVDLNKKTTNEASRVLEEMIVTKNEIVSILPTTGNAYRVF